MTESINPNGSKHHYSKGLAEGSWKGMKKYLEKEMLCEALWGRISYDFTWYPAFGGLSAVFTVLLDGRPAKKYVGSLYGRTTPSRIGKGRCFHETLDDRLSDDPWFGDVLVRCCNCRA